MPGPQRPEAWPVTDWLRALTDHELRLVEQEMAAERKRRDADDAS